MSEHLPAEYCRGCGYILDAVDRVQNDGAKPTSGDVSFCMACGHISLFGPDLKRRTPTAKELEEMFADRAFAGERARFENARMKMMEGKIVRNGRIVPA